MNIFSNTYISKNKNKNRSDAKLTYSLVVNNRQAQISELIGRKLKRPICLIMKLISFKYLSLCLANIKRVMYLCNSYQL